MLRLLTGLVFAAVAGGLWPAAADDPPRKLPPEERKELDAKWRELNAAAGKAYQERKYPEAQKALEEALGIVRRLYPGDEFPDGHLDLAGRMSNLAILLAAQGKLAEAEPLYRDTLEMCRRLFKGDHPTVAFSLRNLAALYQEQGRLADADDLYRDALEMHKRLFKGDHPSVAGSLNDSARCLREQGRLAEAESLARSALEMRRRLFEGDHPAVAQSLGGLGYLLQDQGKLAEAEQLYKDALEMRKRLYNGDHPEVAEALSNLGVLLHARGKLAEAEPFQRDALEMRKRLYKGDHRDLTGSLNNLGFLLLDLGRLAEAEQFYRDALAMRKRLFKGDNPYLASSLNNLAVALHVRGKLAEAEQLYKDALEMRRRLFDGDHPAVAESLGSLGALHQEQGKTGDAERLCKDALAMSRRLSETFARLKSEGEALTLTASLPPFRDSYLSVARLGKREPAAVYPEVWASKAAVGRVCELRQQAARAAGADPRAAKMLAELADARRRRAERIFAPEAGDPVTRAKREEDIKDLDRRISALDRAIRPLLPAVERQENLAKAGPSDLQKALPADAAVVDFLRYVYFEYDKGRPGLAGERRTANYLAFVVSRDGVARVELGPAEPIEAAVAAWREAITGGKEVPAAVPGKVRELVWEKVRKELPAGTRTVYVSPDLALCRVPWAALPGDKPGTVLLEDVAVAVIPHGGFLLDQLWPQDLSKNPPNGVLVVGGVDYRAEPAAGQPANRDLPVKPDTRGWAALPGAAVEAAGVAGAAARKKLAVTPLRAEKATASAVLAELPKARYAHFATHGFFADPSFRSVFQLDPRHFEKTHFGERVGAGALSPLVMTGLVLAGANNPKTPGRGIVTGESLIDLDLSGLELAVLSACETGLGDVAGGEGTFGLQRAFHLAGAKNVVASLWKVPDRPTAALMALFYRNLWEKDLTPVEALRQAQLEIYRNPDKIAGLAEGFRGPFKEVPGAAEAEVKPGADGKAHPRLWAAFTLSGAGR